MKKKLTAKGISALKSKSDRYDCWDTSMPGFSVRVFPSGRKVFCAMYRYRGRLARQTLGVHTSRDGDMAAPRLSLEAARRLAAQVLRQVQLGEDPAAERKSGSFEELASAWIELYAKEKCKSWKPEETSIRNEFLPAWGKLKASDIRPIDISTLLHRVLKRPAPAAANRLHSLLGRIFSFGVKRGVVAENPCLRVDKPAVEKPRERFLTDQEIRQAWPSFMGSLAGKSLALILITSQRPGEVSGIPWSELDLERPGEESWTIQASRYKNGLVHRVALSSMAVELLVELREAARSEWVFPTSRTGRPMSEWHRGEAQKATGIDFTSHDLRRTSSTKMAELGVTSFVIDRVLGHKLRGVIKIYNVYDYAREKRAALEAWSEKLRHIVTGEKRKGKVVQFS